MIKFGVCVGLLTSGSALSFGQWVASEISAPGFQASQGAVIGQNGFAGFSSDYDSVTDQVYSHAMVWNLDGSVAADLNPSSLYSSAILGMGGGYQVGYGGGGTGTPSQAVLWHGTAASATVLGPASWNWTVARGVSAAGQVGYGSSESQTDNWVHALYWTGTESSMLDLNPAGFLTSQAMGIGDGFQVGYGLSDAGNRALLWHGNAGSATDITPVGYDAAWATGANDSNQIGYADLSNHAHGIVWNGSANDFVDLHPIGFDNSAVAGISTSGQFLVGNADHADSVSANSNQAILWQGTGGTPVNLQAYLSNLPYTVNASYALSVSDNGDALGYFYDSNWAPHYVVWTHVVPEPASMLALGLGAVALRRRRKRA